MLQQLGSFTHLIQNLLACLHIHIVNSQDGGQLATLFVLKANNWDSNQQPFSVEQGFCQYTVSMFRFTLRTHLFGKADHKSLLTISILSPLFFISFISLPAAYMIFHTVMPSCF